MYQRLKQQVFFFLLLLLSVAGVVLIVQDPQLPEIQKQIAQLSLSPALPSPTPIPAVLGDQAMVTVMKVIDGDTIELSTGEKVRYIGIDTPETKHPTKGVQCFGKEASQRNQELVGGKVVQLEKDVSETDRYGRLLRYVWVDGRLINQQLVEEGFAHASSYPPDIAKQNLFRAAEQQARTNGLGLWSACPL